MLGKESPQSVRDSYKRSQKIMPFVGWGLVVLLVAVGVIILVVWFTGNNPPQVAIFATPTATSTNTFTPTPVTPTATATATATETLTPTITLTNTPSGPVEYVVQENDTCWDLAVANKVDLNVLLAINNFGNSCPIKPGDKILIPLADQELPTETALPTDFPRGGKIEYTVKLGESLQDIASKFDSTVEAILAIKENGLAKESDLKAGQKLIIPARIVTATPTPKPSATVTPGGPTDTPVPPTATATSS